MVLLLARPQEEREERLKGEAAELVRTAQDDAADDEWARLLKTEEEDAQDVEYPPDGCFCESPVGNDDSVDPEAEDDEAAEEEEDEEEDFVLDEEPLGDDDEDGDAKEEEDEQDAEDAAELQEVIRKINAGEFVPPRMPDFLRNLLRRKPAKAPPPPPAQEPGPEGPTASLTLGALRVLPNYTVSRQAGAARAGRDKTSPRRHDSLITWGADLWQRLQLRL